MIPPESATSRRTEGPSPWGVIGGWGLGVFAAPAPPNAGGDALLPTGRINPKPTVDRKPSRTESPSPCFNSESVVLLSQSGNEDWPRI